MKISLLFIAIFMGISLDAMYNRSGLKQLFLDAIEGDGGSTIGEIEKFILEVLLDVDADLGEGFTAIHLAVVQGKKEVVTQLVRMGANPHIQNSEGDTALQIAVRERRSIQNGHEIAMALLKSNHRNLVFYNKHLNDLDSRYLVENYQRTLEKVMRELPQEKQRDTI